MALRKLAKPRDGRNVSLDQRGRRGDGETGCFPEAEILKPRGFKERSDRDGRNAKNFSKQKHRRVRRGGVFHIYNPSVLYLKQGYFFKKRAIEKIKVIIIVAI